jgi:nucleoside-diphosphate-sugar epimerase
MNEIYKQFKGVKVLITGATGFTGQDLTRKLAEAGAQINVIARQSSDISSLSDLDINWFRGEVYDDEVLLSAVEGVEYIFHVAAAFREEKATEDDYRLVHVHSTEVLARAVTGKPEFKCFVHVSTVGIHGHIEDGLADENYRAAPGDEYQSTKLEGEQWIKTYGDETGLPYTIIRPGPIYGPGDMRLLKFFKMVDKGFILMLGKGKGMYHFVHVDDLTNVMLMAAVKKEALGEIFIAVSDDDPISIINMGKTIGEAIGKPPRVIRLPIQPFYWAASHNKAICNIIGGSPVIYKRRVSTFINDRMFDNRKLKNVLGYEPLYSNRKGLFETAHWYQEHGHIGK